MELAGQLRQWHLKVIEIVKRGQHRKSLDKLFQGFKPAVESCYFNWEVVYPLDGITYCSADKKSATFCWSRAVQHQRGVKSAAGAGGESSELGGRAEGGAGGEYKGRPNSHSTQQEVAVRPKETILTKRKGLSVTGGGGMLVRLGGTVSLSLEDGGGKCMYKGPGSSSGGKLKLTQGGGKGAAVGVPGGGLGSSKHTTAKRRTSSEDSSLEPDLAELSLDDGCNLALGAEASNTFEFLPPPPEMLPSPSPLLRESHKYNSSSSGGSKIFETSRSSHASAAAESAPPCFPSKENGVIVVGVPGTTEKEAEVEPVHNRDEDVDSAASNQPLISTITARAGTTQTSDKPAQGCKEVVSPGAAAGGGAAVEIGAAHQVAEAVRGAADGEAVGEDDYQAYYLSAASEEGLDRQLADNHQEDEPDIFAGIKPLEQEGRMEVSTEEQKHGFSHINTTEKLFY